MYRILVKTGPFLLNPEVSRGTLFQIPAMVTWHESWRLYAASVSREVETKWWDAQTLLGLQSAAFQIKILRRDSQLPAAQQRMKADMLHWQLPLTRQFYTFHLWTLFTDGKASTVDTNLLRCSVYLRRCTFLRRLMYPHPLNYQASLRSLGTHIILELQGVLLINVYNPGIDGILSLKEPKYIPYRIHILSTSGWLYTCYLV